MRRALNDLYVRFFRMAERHIVEKTGQGVVCFISNYSWLDGLSFTGMRERYLEAFDAIRIDNLHGDRIISEDAPDGRTSETVFAIRGQSPGIKIGTAITMLSKSGNQVALLGNSRLLYRDFHHARADERRQALLDSIDAPGIDSGYSALQPSLPLGLPFTRIGGQLKAGSTGRRCRTCCRNRFRASTRRYRLDQRIADAAIQRR